MSDALAKPEWATPTAMAIPKEGFFKLEQRRFGPIFPKTPACYGFSVVAKVKPGTTVFTNPEGWPEDSDAVIRGGVASCSSSTIFNISC